MIKSLEIKNFRNHKKVKINDFGSSLNLFMGKNGEGKTNILESIYMLCYGRSFRSSYISPLVKENEDIAYACLKFKRKAEHKIELLLKKGEKKALKIDGENVKKMSDIFSLLPVVCFCPEDLKLIKESSSHKRRYLDIEISRIRPSYIDALKKYKKLIAEKNKVLKTKDAEKLIDVYNEQIIKYAAVIYKNREKYMKKVKKVTNKLLSDMGKDYVFSYSFEEKFEDAEKEIREKLERYKKRELEERQSIFGPHRQEINFYLNEKDVRQFASQGEAGTIAVALKMAAAEIIKDTFDEKPILILDDVFSFLDDIRKKWVIKKASKCQSFISIAAAKPKIIDGAKIYFLKDNKVYKQKEDKK